MFIIVLCVLITMLFVHCVLVLHGVCVVRAVLFMYYVRVLGSFVVRVLSREVRAMFIVRGAVQLRVVCFSYVRSICVRVVLQFVRVCYSWLFIVSCACVHVSVCLQ